ncbi:MAG: winged helix-turn-helix transcriptional regulator [Solirubrobacterales bacterium]|nr:winged helix-turn-helix transcriptional regulator [Solirubrobacterales bacterium]
MAVNPISPVNPISTSPPEASLENDLRTLLSHVRPVLGALKRGAPPPAVFHEAFERGSLGPRHAPVLMAVALQGDLSVSDLAEQVNLSLSTTSLLVGELSRAGLVERSEDPHDRRRTIVALNRAYREAAEAWLHERVGLFRRTLERLSPDARANFIEGWRILAEEAVRTRPDRADCEPDQPA